MIEIDGSAAEGGGQMLRTALSLSSLTGKPFAIKNIRSNRPKPGLAMQHLTAVNAVAQICGAEVEGAELGSCKLLFKPGTIKGGNFLFEVGTAGSTMLVLQTILPVLSFAKEPSTVHLSGGTSVPFSPASEYVENVFLYWACSMGIQARLRVEKAGWYPIGGGKAVAIIEPITKLSALAGSTRGKLSSLKLQAIFSNLDAEVVRRMISASEKFFVKNRFALSNRITAEVIEKPSIGKGALFFVEAAYASSVAGFSCFARKDRAAEEVARQACAEFIAFDSTNAVLDEHAADQLSLYCALAEGKSNFSVSHLSDHLRTNVEIIEKFLPVSFNLVEGKPAKVSINGVGFGEKNLLQ